MTLSLENLSTRLPSPLADTLTAALLLGLSDLLPAPDNLAGRAGAKLAVNDAILLIRYMSAQCAAKSSCAFYRYSFVAQHPRFPVTSRKSGGKSQISTGL